MALDVVLSVANLASGASVVVTHGVSDHLGSLKPNWIIPDRPTPIAVTNVTATQVTFTNLGSGTESAFFHAKRDHSIQQAGNVEMFWQGQTGLSSFLLLNPQWTDLMVPDTLLRPGGTAPTLTTFKGGTRMNAYGEGEESLCTVQIPHGWLPESSIYPHLHVSFPNANAGNYVWGFEYTLADVDTVFPDTNTIETPQAAAPGVAYNHTLALFPGISMAGIKDLSPMITFRLFRKAGIAGAYGSDIFLLEFDFHYQLDTLGSRQEYVK